MHCMQMGRLWVEEIFGEIISCCILHARCLHLYGTLEIKMPDP